MGWFGWLLLSATAMAAWCVAQVLFGWWGLVAGFVVGGLFCLGMAWAEARRACDYGGGRWRCAECGAALPPGAVVCRYCRGLAAPGAGGRPGARSAGAWAAPAATAADPAGGADSLAGALFRATAPVATQLSANYSWRNWAGALLIVGGLAGAIGAAVVGWPAQVAALTAGLGAGLAILRWMPPGD